MAGHHPVSQIKRDVNDPIRRARITKMRNAIRISEEIHQMRKIRGLSRRQLADLIGLEKCYSIARAEDADYTYINESLELLAKIAKHFDVKVNLALIEEVCISKL